MKKGICVDVSPETVKKAKDLGLDVSEFVERALKRAITALERSESETSPASE